MGMGMGTGSGVVMAMAEGEGMVVVMGGEVEVGTSSHLSTGMGGVLHRGLHPQLIEDTSSKYSMLYVSMSIVHCCIVHSAWRVVVSCIRSSGI